MSNGLNIDYLDGYSATERLALAKMLWQSIQTAITDNDNITSALPTPPLTSVSSTVNASALSTAIESQTIDTWNSQMTDAQKEVVYSARRLLYVYLNLKTPEIPLLGTGTAGIIIYNGVAVQVQT